MTPAAAAMPNTTNILNRKQKATIEDIVKQEDSEAKEAEVKKFKEKEAAMVTAATATS
jgi:hypothetical protein